MQSGKWALSLKNYVRNNANLYVFNRIPTLVYTGGRVGSMAMTASLWARGNFVFQIHTLNPDRLKTEENPPHWLWIYEHIIRARRRARIINIVRDPAPMMISRFFSKVKRMTGREDAASALNVDELLNLFLHDYFDQKRHLDVLDWHSVEMKPNLGVDVYQFPSPAEQGYARFASANYDVLALKTELDDATKSRVVGEFVELSNLAILRTNVTESRPSAENYRLFKERLKIPSNLLDIIYDSQYARHFYADTERAAMRVRWE